jgi:hypothetical protein
MPDNNIRCALAFRLDGKAVTCLAEYKHDPKQSKNFSETVATVIGKSPPRASSEPGKIGGFENVIGDMEQYVYGADQDGLCIAVITGQKYPSRVAIQMLTELHEQFRNKYGSSIPTASAGSLTRKSKSTLSSICNKYDDLSNIDKTQALIGKVDTVKGRMQENISSMLENTDKVSNMAEQSDQLSEQANVFKKKSTDLRKQMRCKNLKMTIILVSIVVGILLVILVPLILKMKKAAEEGN